MNYYQAADVIISRLRDAFPKFAVVGLVDASELETALKNQHVIFVSPGLDRIVDDRDIISPDITTGQQNWIVTLAISSAYQQNTLSKLNRYNEVGEYVSLVFDTLHNYKFSEFFSPLKRENSEFRPATISGKVFVPLQFSTVLSYAV